MVVQVALLINTTEKLRNIDEILLNLSVETLDRFVHLKWFSPHLFVCPLMCNHLNVTIYINFCLHRALTRMQHTHVTHRLRNAYPHEATQSVIPTLTLCCADQHNILQSWMLTTEPYTNPYKNIHRYRWCVVLFGVNRKLLSSFHRKFHSITKKIGFAAGTEGE